MEGLNHAAKIDNIPNNRPLCRIKSRMQDRNDSVTQLSQTYEEFISAARTRL